MGVNEKVLSEVYYKNGFLDGAMAPMYIAIGPLEVIKTMSHDLKHFKERLKLLILMVLLLIFMNIYLTLGKNRLWLVNMIGL